MEARILEWTRRAPRDGSTHWSTRKLAAHLGVHHMMVARVWKRARLQPQRIERYMMSDDPDFEQKAADVIGLYVKPPQHASFSAWMKRPASRRWTGWTRYCHWRPAEPSDMASSTTVTAPLF